MSRSSDNAFVTGVKNELEEKWWSGALDGYYSDPNILPSWWSTATPLTMHSYQRGYMFGRELRAKGF